MTSPILRVLAGIAVILAMTFAFPNGAAAYALWGYHWEQPNNDVIYCYPSGYSWPPNAVVRIDSASQAWNNIAGSNFDLVKTNTCSVAQVELRYQAAPGNTTVPARTECVVTGSVFVSCDVYFNPSYAADFTWAISQTCAVQSLSASWVGGFDCKILGGAAARHEFGHVAGLSHVGGANGCFLGSEDDKFAQACPADDEPQLFGSSGDGYSRIISQDDRNGVDAIYPSGF